MTLQQQLKQAFAPFEAFATISDLRHATLYPCCPRDGLTPLLVEGVVGDAPFKRVSYPGWHAEIFYGRLVDDYRVFADAALSMMDCVRRHLPDDSEVKAFAQSQDLAPLYWMKLLYRVAERTDSPLLEVYRGRLQVTHGTGDALLSGIGGPMLKLPGDDERLKVARSIAEDERHRFIQSRRNVFLLTRYAIEADAINDPPDGHGFDDNLTANDRIQLALTRDAGRAWKVAELAVVGKCDKGTVSRSKAYQLWKKNPAKSGRIRQGFRTTDGVEAEDDS